MLATFIRPASTVDRRSAGYVPVSELHAVTYGTDRNGSTVVVTTGRAMAAVKLAMGSDSYTDAEREDTAAELTARTVTDAAAMRRRCHCGGPAQWRHTVTDDYGTAVEVTTCTLHRATVARPVLHREDAIPADLCSVTRLYHLACTLRRSIDRDRARDAADAARRAETADLEAHSPVAPDWDAHTPHGARRTALEMLSNAGVIGDTGRRIPGPRNAPPMGRPHGTPREVLAFIDAAMAGRLLKPLPLRPARVEPKIPAPLWTLAYTVARSATGGLESREIAAELDLTFSAYRQHLSRAATLLAKTPGAQRDWAEALAILPGGIGKSHATPLPESMGVRSAPGHTFPNTDAERRTVPATPLTETRTRATRKAWHTVPVGRRQTADWAVGLPPRSASRLAAAATVSRKRTETAPDTLRIHRRTEAGIRLMVL